MSPIKFSYDVNDSDFRGTFFQEVLPKCIDTLRESVEPVWGKMSAQHMVEHLILSFQMSTDKLDLECNTPERKRVKLQAFLNINRPMPKDFINPVAGTELLDLQYQNLRQAKEGLKEEVQYYLAYYKNNPEITQINPTFGELNSEQWEKFHFKHCFHHLSQFNLIASNKNT
jgi:oxepin-CoA hydrolase/3-oxo-5,6-dehydrosuberyl-CoA semialdehyde dehydrogenase